LRHETSDELRRIPVPECKQTTWLMAVITADRVGYSLGNSGSKQVWQKEIPDISAFD